MAKAILGRVFALWALVIFVPTLLIAVWPILISFLVPEPYGIRIFQTTSRYWMAFFLYIIGCSIRIKGKEHYDNTKRYVITSNHRSFFDVPLLTPFFPGPNKTIAKKSLSRIPFFGWIYARGSVLVDRSNDRSRKQSFDAMKRVLVRDHINMAIYPEGTRNRTGQPLKSFYDGAFRLAMATNTEIIPVVMRFTDTVFPPARFFFVWPHRLEMHLLPPIASHGKKIEELKQKVFDTMWKYIEENGV